MAYFLKALAPLDKAKLMKLLYLADRDAFLNIGHPITGDRQFAMRYGPAPCECLDIVNADVDARGIFQYIHVVDDKVSLRADHPGLVALQDDEICILNQVANDYGATPTWTLVRKLHQLPEYREVYVPDTSTQIPYETLLKHYGTEEQFRHGRPVVSTEMAAHIECPFPQSSSDADL